MLFIRQARKGGANIFKMRIGNLFARAAYGLKEDPTFKENWQQMDTRPIIRGAYHFFLLREDPIEQARFFLQVIAQSRVNDLCPAVDFEEMSLSSEREASSTTAVQEKLFEYLNYLELQVCFAATTDDIDVNTST